MCPLIPVNGPGRREVCNLSISSEALELRGEPCSFTSSNAGVAELADALDSKSSGRKAVWVRAPPPAMNSQLIFDVGR